MPLNSTQYEDRLLIVTRNLVVYNNYDGDVTKAAAVVKKYFKAKSLTDCQVDLQLFVTAYKDAIDFVEINKTHYRKKIKEPDLSDKEKAFFEKYTGISEIILQTMIMWVFNWYHER